MRFGTCWLGLWFAWQSSGPVPPRFWGHCARRRCLCVSDRPGSADTLDIQLDDASAPQPVLDLEQIPMDGVSIFDGFGAMLPFDFGLN